MMLCGCVVGQKGWTKGGRGKDGRGGGREGVGGKWPLWPAKRIFDEITKDPLLNVHEEGDSL